MKGSRGASEERESQHPDMWANAGTRQLQSRNMRRVKQVADVRRPWRQQKRPAAPSAFAPLTLFWGPGVGPELLRSPGRLRSGSSRSTHRWVPAPCFRNQHGPQYNQPTRRAWPSLPSGRLAGAACVNRGPPGLGFCLLGVPRRASEPPSVVEVEKRQIMRRKRA